MDQGLIILWEQRLASIFITKAAALEVQKRPVQASCVAQKLRLLQQALSNGIKLNMGAT